MTLRPLPPPPQRFSLMLVSRQAASRQQLLASCREALPCANMVEVVSFADAVLQLAGEPAAVVVLDQQHLPDLCPAAALMLRGLAPEARILAIGDDPGVSGVEAVADRQALTARLRNIDCFEPQL